MPARSNLYQRLVFEIHRGLGDGWDVRESRPLTDSITGESREVDIVAEGKVHSYGIVMSVEVCDRHRVADVTWVERLNSQPPVATAAHLNKSVNRRARRSPA